VHAASALHHPLEQALLRRVQHYPRLPQFCGALVPPQLG
jgi:hypothetical protein